MLLRIGRSIAVHQDFAAAFPQNKELQILITEYLALIVDICTLILRQVQRKFVAKFAASLISTFDSVIKPIETDLRRLRSMRKHWILGNLAKNTPPPSTCSPDCRSSSLAQQIQICGNARNIYSINCHQTRLIWTSFIGNTGGRAMRIGFLNR